MPAEYHPAPIKYYWQRETDALIQQVNPVSGTWYPVLAPSEDVGIVSAVAHLTWAVTQPTPLEIRVVIDGQTIIHSFVNPVSGIAYELYSIPLGAITAQPLFADPSTGRTMRFFDYAGQSISVDVRITWAVTQPTPLICRVKWCRWLPT